MTPASLMDDERSSGSDQDLNKMDYVEAIKKSLVHGLPLTRAEKAVLLNQCVFDASKMNETEQRSSTEPEKAIETDRPL